MELLHYTVYTSAIKKLMLLFVTQNIYLFWKLKHRNNLHFSFHPPYQRHRSIYKYDLRIQWDNDNMFLNTYFIRVTHVLKLESKIASSSWSIFFHINTESSWYESRLLVFAPKCGLRFYHGRSTNDEIYS